MSDNIKQMIWSYLMNGQFFLSPLKIISTKFHPTYQLRFKFNLVNKHYFLPLTLYSTFTSLADVILSLPLIYISSRSMWIYIVRREGIDCVCIYVRACMYVYVYREEVSPFSFSLQYDFCWGVTSFQSIKDNIKQAFTLPLLATKSATYSTETSREVCRTYVGWVKNKGKERYERERRGKKVRLKDRVRVRVR